MYSKRLLATPRLSLERKQVINEIKQEIIESHYESTNQRVKYDTEQLNGIINDLMTCGNDVFQAEIVLQELEDLIKGVNTNV